MTPMVLCALEVTAKGAVADIRLNDIPVTVVGLPTGEGQAFIPVPENVVRGPNRLAAMIAPVREVTLESRVTIRIAVFSEGDDYFTNAGQELARIDWDGQMGRTVLARDFAASFGPSSWAWGRCATWYSPEEALGDAAPFVRDLVRAYWASDAAWLEAHSAAKFADLALAYTNVSEAEMKAQIARLIREDPPRPLASLPPPQPLLCGNGRLLLLLGPGGGAYLNKQPADPASTGFEVKLGKLDGVWQIIR